MLLTAVAMGDLVSGLGSEGKARPDRIAFGEGWSLQEGTFVGFRLCEICRGGPLCAARGEPLHGGGAARRAGLAGWEHPARCREKPEPVDIPPKRRTRRRTRTGTDVQRSWTAEGRSRRLGPALAHFSQLLRMSPCGTLGPIGWAPAPWNLTFIFRKFS